MRYSPMGVNLLFALLVVFAAAGLYGVKFQPLVKLE